MRFFANLFVVTLVGLMDACAPYGRCSDLQVGEQVRLSIKDFRSGEPCDPRLEIGEGTVLEVTVAEFLAGDSCESATGPVRDVGNELKLQEFRDDQSASHTHSDFWGRYDFETADCSGWLELSFELPVAEDILTEAEIYAGSSDCEVRCGFSASASAVRF